MATVNGLLKELRKRDQRDRTKGWFMAVNVLLLCLAITEGCAQRKRVPRTATPILNYCADLATASPLWAQEVGRRYDDVVLVIVHGNEIDGEWYAFPDGSLGMPMRAFVANVRKHFPDQRIVLLACNPTHLPFDAGNVTYADDSVWVRPDRNVGPFTNFVRDLPDNEIGSIFEFTENM